MRDYGLESTDSRLDPVAGYFEHCKEPMDSIKVGIFFTSWAIISFSRRIAPRS